MSAEPLITLSVIVRDEARRLERLLTAHAGLWDEAVVVDTGSQDATIEVARACGARVHQRPWDDDFSAARNHGLDRCRGRWVLVLDCDEAIAPDDFASVRACAGVTADCGWVLTQRNYVDDDALPDWRPVGASSPDQAGGARGFVPAPSVRLFPAAPGIRYSGVVHETVEPALAARGLGVRDCPVAVHHQGHRDGPARRRARLTRDGILLRRKLHLNPVDPVVRRQMAVQLVHEGYPELAIRLLRRTVIEAPGGPETSRARRVLARLLAARGETSDALAQATAALYERPDWPGAWFDAVRLYALAGDADRAALVCRRARRLFPLDSRFFEPEVSSFLPSCR